MIEGIALILDSRLDVLFNTWYNTEIDFIERALDEIVLFEGIKLPDVLNHSMYNWYFGNFYTKLLVMIFQPYLCSHPCFFDDYNRRLSDTQIRCALQTIYKLLSHRLCDPNKKDYYEHTPYTYLVELEKAFELPEYIVKWLPAFKYVFKHGYNVVENQQSYIRRWYVKYLNKRRRAVKIIESWWLEQILNPDNKVGKSYILKLSKRFDTMKVTI